MTVDEIARRLGGRKAFKRPVRSELDLAEAVGEGLDHSSLEFVLEAEDLAPQEAFGLIGSRRTLMRKMSEGKALSPSESDRLARAVRVIARAEEAIGDRDKARRWLRKPNRALNGERPLALLSSDAGARLVENVLGRIEHGVYS